VIYAIALCVCACLGAAPLAGDPAGGNGGMPDRVAAEELPHPQQIAWVDLPEPLPARTRATLDAILPSGPPEPPARRAPEPATLAFLFASALPFVARRLWRSKLDG